MLKPLFLLLALTYQGQPAKVRVVDGDTLYLGSAYYRILGYDAPELFSYRCSRERDLAWKAKTYVERLFQQRKAELIFTGRYDIYGRKLAQVLVNGRDLAEIMIERKLARPYDGKSARKTWCSSTRP